MNFLKQKWFKAGLLLSALLVSLSALYYLVFFLPSDHQSTTVREWNMKCREFGEKTYGASEFGADITVVRKYIFSPELNTCVGYAEVSMQNENGGYDIRHALTDIIKDNPIVGYSTPCLDIEEAKMLCDENTQKFERVYDSIFRKQTY